MLRQYEPVAYLSRQDNLLRQSGALVGNMSSISAGYSHLQGIQYNSGLTHFHIVMLSIIFFLSIFVIGNPTLTEF